MADCRYGFGVVALALWLAPSTLLAQTRVACVGDSITYGYGLGNRDQEAYPAVLAELLGSEFDVGNYGDSGSTLQDAGDKPWREQAVYSECLAFVPNVVVIMLGTNDAKPANWSEAGFVEDYQSLIAEFRDLGAEVYLATPPPVVPPGAFDIQPDVVNETLVPLVRQVAVEEGARLIDVYAALEDRPELLPDTVHPNAAGARVIAETVADALLVSDETTATSTQTAVTSGATSSTGGIGGATGSGSDGFSASSAGLSASSAGLSASSAGLTSSVGASGDVSSLAAVSSTGPGTAATSVGATASGPASSSQATSAATASVATSTGTGGGAPETAGAEADDAGCACGLGRATRAPWHWCLVPLLALTRRRASRQCS